MPQVLPERRALSVAIFARNGGRALLIKHTRLGVWLPPGGEVRPDETPLEAAQRELFEETGLRGRFEVVSGVDGTPPGFLAYEEHPAGSKGLHLNLSFVADVSTLEVKPNHEFDEHRWVADAPDLDCPPNVRQLLALALEDAPSLQAIARTWIEAFNARDLDRLMGLYADDAVHTSPNLRARKPGSLGEVRGKTALRAWWADSMERLPGLRYELRQLTASLDQVFMQYERTNPGEPARSVAEVLVCAGGRIRASRVYNG
jgi:8-oxo-dGTP diphosphatase